MSCTRYASLLVLLAVLSLAVATQAVPTHAWVNHGPGTLTLSTADQHCPETADPCCHGRLLPGGGCHAGNSIALPADSRPSAPLAAGRFVPPHSEAGASSSAKPNPFPPRVPSAS